MDKNSQGDFYQSIHFESDEIHSRRLRRIPGLYHSVYPGIREGILDRIILHRDTGTGVFGIKDNTFNEDKARYKSVKGAMSHVSLLNFAWNCLSAPILKVSL